MKKKKLAYSNKPFIKRDVLFFAGLFNFLMGYAIYFIIKDDKSKEFEAEFIKRGANFGLLFTIIAITYKVLEYFKVI